MAMPFAGRAMLMGEKWHVTPTGSDAHPSPIVSANPLLEVNVTLIVAFCVVLIVIVGGVTPTLKLPPAPVIETGSEVDGLWVASPP